MPGLQLIASRLAGLRARWAAQWADRRGAVAVIFAVSVVPLAMVVGLASDYSFYVQVQSQLNLAADTAAMQAVRVASEVSSTKSDGTVMSPADYQTAVQTAGQQAGTQWFQAQMGSLANGSVPIGNIVVNVGYNPVGSRFTSSVSYTGTVPTHFGALFNRSSFSIGGAATAVISNSFVEVMMLLDNSSSMLIPTTAADIARMEAATPCATYGVDDIHTMDGAYFQDGTTIGQYDQRFTPDFWSDWVFASGLGYNASNNTTPNNPPPVGTVNGNCDPSYTGDAAACAYPPSAQYVGTTNSWYCSNKGGYAYKGQYYAQAPCALACHTSSSNNDFFGLSRNMNPPIELRLDVVQSAVAGVVKTLNDKQQPNQFSVGVYAFSDKLSTVWPQSGEATTDLATALSKTQAMTPPVTQSGVSANTNFKASMQSLNGNVAAAGDGSMPTTPLKNLFIVTDGVNDVPSGGFLGTIGPMTSTNSEQTCSLFWAKGFNVYVLYTPYLPLPAGFYRDQVKQYAETTDPTMSTVAALQACARYPSHFYVATDKTAINTAMQTMLAAALNSPGRVSN
ncbi:MAG: TadE/TadG family type IV pilus assembly protein [Janthinobacterium lividum]